jgi:hypothetical protein
VPFFMIIIFFFIKKRHTCFRPGQKCSPSGSCIDRQVGVSRTQLWTESSEEQLCSQWDAMKFFIYQPPGQIHRAWLAHQQCLPCSLCHAVKCRGALDRSGSDQCQTWAISAWRLASNPLGGS